MTRLLRQLGTLMSTIVLVALGFLLSSADPAQAYTYNSYTAEPTITNTTSTVNGTDTVTVTFTMPMAMSTSGYVTISSPYLYSYSGGTYQSDYADLTNATMTSSSFTQSSKSSTYLTIIPSANLSANQSVSVTLTGVENPNMEGNGTWYVSGYEYSSDIYNSFYGSGSVTYGDIDLTVTMTTSTGAALSSVYVYLSYSGSNSSYEYFSGVTNSLGKTSFPGLTSGRTYSVSFYYNGTATTDKAPAATTLAYTGGSPQLQTYAFVAPNITTTYKDASGVAIPNAYWYITNSSYSFWQYGYTTSSGVISAAVTTNGTYTLKVAESSTAYNYYTYTFTVTNGVPNLASTISIPSPEVSGTVTAGGTGVSGVTLTLRNANWSVYQTKTTSSTGAFSFAIGQAGTYTITVSNYGLPTGYFPSDAVTVTVDTAGVAEDALTIALSDAVKTITGTVKDASGNAITDAYVYGYQTNTYAYASTSTNSSGAFTFSATKGAWTVYSYPSTWPSSWASPASQTITFANDETDETKTATFTVDKYNAHITGTFQYPDGTTVGASDIYCYAYGGKNNTSYSYGYTNASGAIDLLVSEGTHNVYCYFYGSSGSAKYVVPTIASQTVAADSTVSMGTIELEEKTASIEGTVALSDGTAQANISLYAYQEGTWNYAYATTDANGKYTFQVNSGKWNVYLYTWGLTNDAGQALLYTGGTKSVTVAKDEKVTGQDFTLAVADAQITFQAVDSSDADLTTEYGWASILDASGTTSGWSYNGCYVNAGSCNLSVGSGTAYKIQYYSYSNWSSSYDADATTYTFSQIEIDDAQTDTVTLTSGENQTVELVMAQNDVTISGSFKDGEGNPVNIYGNVYASNETNGWASTYVSNTSSYSLKLSAGTWRLSYETYSGYAKKGSTSIEIEAASGDTITDADFSVVEENSTVSGTVVDGEGEPVETPTLVEVSTEYGTSETATAEEFQYSEVTYTDDEGNFEMDVPEGTYYIRAATDSTEYLDPQPVQISADEEGSAEGTTLKLVEPDAEITVSVIDGLGITVNNRRALAVSDPVAGVYLSGYSDLGNIVTTTTNESGGATIPALQGDTWHIIAFYQVDQTAYYSETADLEITSAAVSTTIPLTESLELPEAQSAQFDPQEPAVLTVTDSEGEDVLTVNIPANTITTQDLASVTVRAEPTIQLAQEPGSSPLSLGFDLTATSNDTGDPLTTFAGDLTIETTYDEADLTAAGVTEDQLSFGYYEDAAETWRDADGGVVINTETNTMTLSVDHFSTFAVLSPTSSIASTDEAEEEEEAPAKGEDKKKDGILHTPKKLKTKKRSDRQIILDWKGDKDAASYRVQVLNKKTKKVIRTIRTTKSKKTLKKLKSNSAYLLQVRAVGLTGSKTPYSDQLATRTKPAMPTLMTIKEVKQVSSSASTATLSWTKPRGTIKSYTVQVFSGKEKIKEVNTKTAEATIEGLTPGSTYTFRVRAQFNKRNLSGFSKKTSFIAE